MRKSSLICSVPESESESVCVRVWKEILRKVAVDRGTCYKYE